MTKRSRSANGPYPSCRPSDRWYPVLLRYIFFLSQRIDGYGGGSGSIPALLTGLGPKLEIMKY
jgi:hypothetical protein